MKKPDWTTLYWVIPVFSLMSLGATPIAQWWVDEDQFTYEWTNPIEAFRSGWNGTKLPNPTVRLDAAKYNAEVARITSKLRWWIGVPAGVLFVTQFIVLLSMDASWNAEGEEKRANDQLLNEKAEALVMADILDDTPSPTPEDETARKRRLETEAEALIRDHVTEQNRSPAPRITLEDED